MAPKPLRQMADCFSQAITAHGKTRIRGGLPARCSRPSSSGRWIIGHEIGRAHAPRSDILHQPPIELRSAVAEEAERRSVLFCTRKIERRYQGSSLVRAELGEDIAALVADEAT